MRNASREKDWFELLKYGVNLFLSFFKVFSDLGLFNFSPLAPITSLILLEMIFELPEQVLIRILLEDTFELLDAVLVRTLLTFEQEVIDFFSCHAKATFQDILQILIVGLYLLDI